MAESKLNLFQKLQKARVELQEMNLKKSGHNKFAGFSYYELSDFLPAINIICHNVGLFTAISFEMDYAILRIYDCEDMEKFIEFKSPMKEIQQKGYSVRQVEEIVREKKNSRQEATPDNTPEKEGTNNKQSIEFHQLKRQLTQFFQTPVQLTCNTKGTGKISIKFKNEQELERIIAIFDKLNQQ